MAPFRFQSYDTITTSLVFNLCRRRRHKLKKEFCEDTSRSGRGSAPARARETNKVALEDGVGAQDHLNTLAFHICKLSFGQRIEVDGWMLYGACAVSEEV